MPDTRELILQRLMTILQGVPGILNVYRDRAAVPPRDVSTGQVFTPAVILLDGKETKVGKSMGRTVRGADGSIAMPPAPMMLEPQIFVILTPVPLSEAESQGPLLSSFRVAVLKAIDNDPPLRMLLTDDGEIEYFGHDTDMQTGSTLEGWIQFHFGFTYIFDVSKLS